MQSTQIFRIFVKRLRKYSKFISGDVVSLPKLQSHLAAAHLVTIVQIVLVLAFIPIWIFEGFASALILCGLGIWGFQVMRPGPDSELDRFTGRGK